MQTPSLQIFPVSGGFPIPLEVVVLQIVVAVVVVFISLELFGSRTERYRKYNLLKIPFLRQLAKSRVFQVAVQLLGVALFLFVIVAGFVGTQRIYNIAVVFTWVYWWLLLFILSLFFGRMWCFICPWKALSNWILRRSLLGVTDETDVYGLRETWPKRLRNIFIPTLLFALLFIVDLSFMYGVANVPFVTSVVALVYLDITFVGLFLFRRASFCRYACVIAKFQGLFANFSPFEVRAKNRDVCKGCSTKNCLTGSSASYGCPEYLLLPVVEDNLECEMCLECVKSCPNDNVALNVRPFGVDLAASKRPGIQGAYFSLVLLSVTLLHRTTMTPFWKSFAESFKLGSTSSNFAIAFLTLLLILILSLFSAHYVVSWASKRASGSGSVTLKDVYVNYAYSLVPYAMFYAIGHSLEHLFSEGQMVIPAISDPFGWGWNLFGTAMLKPTPLFTTTVLKWFLILLMIVGTISSVWIAFKRSRILFSDTAPAFRSELPVVAWIITVSMIGMWLLAQSMTFVSIL